MFHALTPAPSGGANQFIRALIGELRRRGLRVELNRLSRRTPACLFNSYNFDGERLWRLMHDGCRLVHRVDGPLAAYRGFDDGTDALVQQLNAEFAEATVLQSRYSVDESAARGLDFRSPVVIPNAVDAAIFHPPSARRSLGGRRVRLVSTSWSPNERKGGATYRWLADNLDRDRFEYTFVGQLPDAPAGVRLISPLRSNDLAEVLRQYDVFVTASVNDPCSNALLEALACGLPALFLDSGGHRELVGEAGVAFTSTDDLLPGLDRLVAEYDERCQRIAIPSMSEVATRYLAVLGLAEAVS